MARQIITIVLLVVLVIFMTYVVAKNRKEKRDRTNVVRTMARVGVFAAISTILYVIPLFNFTIPGILPTFLKFHFDEIPALIAGFAFGPFSAFGIILIKTFIKLPLGGANTMYVGEISDFIYSLALVLPAAIIYKRHRKFKFAALGLAIGFICQIVISTLMNVYVMIPLYMKLFSMNEETIMFMMPPFVKDAKWSYALLSVIPFNVVKNILVIAVTLVVYKPLHRLIEKIKF